MKLIKRTTLHYQEGSSDKIYEVDLCQVDEALYLVNFRYGRRGSNLKEGTKTTQPVALEQAQRVFDKLVGEKTKKGYQDVSTTAVEQETSIPEPVSVPVVDDARKQAILNRLANQDNSKWPLERAIWRAGELKITEAAPLLIQLLGTGKPLSDYCIAWALGWCGDREAIGVLTQLYENPSTPEFVQRIAFEAVLKLADDDTRERMVAHKISQLPLVLSELVSTGYPEAFTLALEDYIKPGDYQNFGVLGKIYQIDNAVVRPALLKILQSAPLKPNYFKQIRHIFQMAEYRHDAEVFGIIAYHSEKQKAVYRYTYSYPNHEYYIRLPDGTHLYTDYKYNNTREYFRRRVWRTLKQLGEEGDTDYVNMAVSILLHYSDADAQPVKESVFYRYRWIPGSWNREIRHNIRHNWDAYGAYLTFNHILYENSPRYVFSTKAWRCREGYKPGDGEPTEREEAFPQLWEQRPDALLKLLLESNCRPVHHFAVKALRTCQQFCASLDLETILKLVKKPYEITAELGWELVRDRYNPSEPNLELISAFVNCASSQARSQAYQWIDEQREFFLADSNFIASLVTSQHFDTRQFARRLLSSSILNDTTARVLIGRIIAELLLMTANQGDLAKEIAETLLISFTLQLRNLGLGVIVDLLNHPIPEIQELGARILLNHEIMAENLPPEFIESLLASPHDSVRVIGIRLFGQLPDEKLIGEDKQLILAMAVSAVTDNRNAIKPIIRRLAAANRDFAMQIAADLIEVLLTAEKHEGVHSYLVKLLREDVPDWMTSVSKETALPLLNAKSSLAQELGGLVLAVNYQNWVSEFATSEIVKLGNHDIIAVREASRQMFSQILDRLRADEQEMISAMRLLESKWSDSREFALRIFTTDFGATEFTPSVLVSICDSVREEARRLGRDLLTRNFQEADGEEYLLKFSEHPSVDMQIFATNYLEKYAVDNAERLRELMPYFISILSRVNRGRVAKDRVLKFLELEAQKSDEAASVVAEIMDRLSLTVAVGDKAAAIRIMLKIHKLYPHLQMPINVKSVVEVRI
ncbi:MAG: HEAT repeat domain-containing protein [Nostocaceae cyanobacterium]|nr:HEAT repeat domain-containing protein [Nostocaceae cyanobacterium]